MGAIRIFWASARPLRPKISEMPAVAAGKARAQFRRCWWRFHQKQRLGEKRGHRIDRHPMGRCRRKLSQIVDGHVDDDIRLCGGPIGAKRRQKSRSRVIFHGFFAIFSARRSPIAAASFRAYCPAIMAFLCHWVCCWGMPRRGARAINN